MDIFLNQLITFYWNNTTNLRPNPLNEARDDGFGMDAVASAGPNANKLHLASDR